MSHLTRFKILAGLLVLLGLSALSILNILSISYILAGLILLGIGVFIHDLIQKKHSILRNYPLLGRLRFIFENERSKIQQYAIEDDINGKPINRERRSDIYQKAKQDTNTVPFGTQLNVYAEGYEHINHSQYPVDYRKIAEPRNTIGSKFCKQPYCASIFNISGMSFGALSSAALTALNKGALLGNFHHTTGEGGLSPYHLQGGDVCFQFGTGYFGAGVTIKGERYFDDKTFQKNALHPNVKLIEVKMSQGAKPGHGGVLPAKKNTPEIAAIRNTESGIDVMSPPFHTAFTDANTLVDFIQKLRVLSNYKPVGIKLCLGNKFEFEELVKAFVARDCYPDFITIDGGEGGTGAAPLVFSNYVGTPLIDALMYVNRTLEQYYLKKEIRIIASGKVTNSFDIIKLLALGANGVNAARAFMLSLGCIQARECDKNTCPVGIATQDKKLIAGLDPTEKSVRVYNYHKNILHEVVELMGAMGVDNVTQLNPSMINIRNEKGVLETYREKIWKQPA
jgi:glutamate synthase domain-containing protein 2